MPKAPATKAGEGKAAPAGSATVAMTDEERMRATMEIMRAVGFERGTPPSPEQIEKVKVLAKEKGLDPDLVAARMATPGGRKRSEGGSSGGSSRGGSSSFGSRGGGSGGSGAGDRGFNNTIVTRTLYKLLNAEGDEKRIEPVSVRLGISDGFYTEVLDGLSDGDTVVTNVTMPGAAVVAGAPSSSMQNPFQGSRGPGGSSGMRGPR
jgi:hypothetical protein